MRLTSVPAEFFGLDVGVVRVGARADLCVVDPEALRVWDPEQTCELQERSELGCRAMVNRPVGVVREVMVSGRRAWVEGSYADDLGKTSYGSVLRAR